MYSTRMLLIQPKTPTQQFATQDWAQTHAHYPKQPPRQRTRINTHIQQRILYQRTHPNTNPLRKLSENKNQTHGSL